MATFAWIVATAVVFFVGGFALAKYLEYRKNNQ